MSDTGYVRLSFEELQNLILVHLISGMDEDGPAQLSDNATETAIGGYTEWVSTGSPVITLGWDWQMLFENKFIRLRRISEPRSNVMLQSPARLDLGHDKTVTLLETFIDAYNWQPEALEQINARYSGEAPGATPAVPAPHYS